MKNTLALRLYGRCCQTCSCLKRVQSSPHRDSWQTKRSADHVFELNPIRIRAASAKHLHLRPSLRQQLGPWAHLAFILPSCRSLIIKCLFNSNLLLLRRLLRKHTLACPITMLPASTMDPSQLFLSFFMILSFLQPFTYAQTTIISNTLPACAQSCPVLIQAQSACVPPPAGAAAVSNQQTYTSCFCQSNYLVPLKSGSASTLCPTCSAQDMSSTQQWFNRLCQQGVAPGGNNNNGGGQQAPKSSSTLKTSSTPPASKQTGSSTAGGVTQDTSPEDQNKSWYAIST